MPHVIVHHVGPALEISLDGTMMLSGPDVSALIASAEAHDPNPLLLSTNDRIDVELPVFQRADVLDAVAPDAGLVDYLWEHVDDATNDDEEGLGLAPIVTGNMVDGRSWGWYLPQDNWFLGPTEQTKHVLRLGLSFEGGMLSTLVQAGAWRLDKDTAVVWAWHEDAGTRLTIWSLYYTPTSDEDLCLDAFRALSDDGDPDCAIEEGDNLPIFSIDRTSGITDDMIGRGLALIWGPCEDHPDYLLHDEWRWSKDHWVRARPT